MQFGETDISVWTSRLKKSSSKQILISTRGGANSQTFTIKVKTLSAELLLSRAKVEEQIHLQQLPAGHRCSAGSSLANVGPCHVTPLGSALFFTNPCLQRRQAGSPLASIKAFVTVINSRFCHL